MGMVPFDEGIYAAKAGRDVTDNPFESGTVAASSWQSGFERFMTLSAEPPRRWGYKQAAHPEIQTLFQNHRKEFIELLADIESNRDFLHGIRYQENPDQPFDPYWNNGFFTSLDASVLVTLLLKHRPRRYIEVGSGNSTAFTRYTIRNAKLPTHITSIDPEPRRDIDTICDRVIRSKVQDCDLSVFNDLEAGDVLFFDGSHMVEPDNDATVFFLEVLPRLRPGVLVQIHDIFWPHDYTQRWGVAAEQYMLGLMLIAKPLPFRLLAANFFISRDDDLSGIVKNIFAPRAEGDYTIPFCTYEIHDLPGTSVWIETT